MERSILVKSPGNRFPFTGLDTAIEHRLEFMDSIGIQTQMMSFAGNIGIDVLPAKEVNSCD